MTITIPSGVVPIRSLSTNEVLYGDRVTTYRWEVLENNAGAARLIGYLDGVEEGSASLSWSLFAAVKGSGSVSVIDLDQAQSGFLTLEQVALLRARIRPVLVVEGLPEIPLGMFLPSGAPEEWSGTGRTVKIELLDRATVLDQDRVETSYTVGTSTPILSAVSTVVSSAGESIVVPAGVTDTLASPMVWPAGTAKLQIVNDLLAALNYNSLWVDGVGNFRATPYELPARRSMAYELIEGEQRELVDGDRSIYGDEWSRDVDLFNVPNKVIAVQSGNGDAPALTGTWTNTDPASPFSFPSRGRWIVRVLENVETPNADNATVTAFLEAKARQSLVAASSVQGTISVKHLPVPIRVSDVMRFANSAAGIDGRYVVTSISLEAHSLGLMDTKLQEVVDL